MINLMLAAASLSLALALAALILALKISRRPPMAFGVPAEEARGESAEQLPGSAERQVRRVNSLAEAAVILGAEALMLFDQQGLLVESYNMAEEHGVKVAASLAELIGILKKMGFPAGTVMFKNGAVSLVVELKKVGDVTPYGLIIGNRVLVEDVEYAREILQRYVESVIERRW